MSEFTILSIEELQESKYNPRRNFDPEQLQQLAENIVKVGILIPLLVRPTENGRGRYEILDGARRYRAAKLAKATELPVRIRPMSDADAIEAIVIANLQRQDLHPLEEARGYQQLLEKGRGYDVARIAERVGRSVKYVYDRIKLLSLTKAAQTAFLEGRLTAGHAIILARLTPADQTRAMEDDRDGLWQPEQLLWDPEDQGAPEDPVKPVSVRELQAWVDKNVRFDTKAADPMLFPETVGTLATARESAEKIIPITYEHYIPEEAREGRTYFPQSWTRADGKHGSKPCDRAVTGFVAVGPSRGEAFKVCIDKDKCDTHWRQERRARERRAKGITTAGGTGKERWQIEQRKRQEEQEREQAERVRWKKAIPTILRALAVAVAKAPTKATGLLGTMIVGELQSRDYGVPKDAADYLKRGTTADDLIRHAAFLILHGEAYSWRPRETLPKRAKAFGIDVRKIVDEVAPPPKGEPTPKTTTRTAAKTTTKKGKAKKARAA